MIPLCLEERRTVSGIVVLVCRSRSAESHSPEMRRRRTEPGRRTIPWRPRFLSESTTRLLPRDECQPATAKREPPIAARRVLDESDSPEFGLHEARSHHQQTVGLAMSSISTSHPAKGDYVANQPILPLLDPNQNGPRGPCTPREIGHRRS